jgi:hypothetical protein
MLCHTSKRPKARPKQNFCLATKNATSTFVCFDPFFFFLLFARALPQKYPVQKHKHIYCTVIFFGKRLGVRSLSEVFQRFWVQARQQTDTRVGVKLSLIICREKDEN